MKEQYPFFRDEDEQTQAVIGEEAVDADLDGDYQKPYAILTQKRLYCKNEQGNFITDAATLKSAGKGLLPGQNWFLWAVVACTGLVLALLCFWYWGMGGKYYIREIDYWTQDYVNSYHSLEEKIPEYEQQIKTYEEALAVRDTAQAEWDGNDYGTLSAHISSISSRVEELPQKIIEYKLAIQEEKKRIEELEEWFNVTAPERLQMYRTELAQQEQVLDNLLSKWDVNPWAIKSERDLIESTKKNINMIITSQQTNSATLEKLRQELSQNERQLSVAQEQLATAKEEMAGMEDQAEAIQQLQARIETQQSIMDGIPYENIKQNIERYETGKSDYKNVQSVQRKISLFQPCLWLLVACVITLVALAGLKQAKTAALAAMISAGVALVCAALSDIRYYSAGSSTVTLSVQALSALAILLAGLAWWQNHKKTVFQIVHNTGAFSFTPSVYPAEELKLFAEQVQLMQAGEENGE